MKRFGMILVVVGILMAITTPSVLASTTPQHAHASTTTHAQGGGDASSADLAFNHAPKCAIGWLCNDLPCSTKGHCGLVELGPTSNLGADQYVFLRGYGLTASTRLFVYYCQYSGSLATAPICPLQGSQLQADPSASLAASADGTVSYAFQVVEADHTGTPLCGVVPGAASVPPVSPCSYGAPFFCDNEGHPCSIDVVDPGLASPHVNTPGPDNAIAVPVSFSTIGAVCAKSNFVYADGEFGFQELFNGLDGSNCSVNKTKATIPVLTSIDGPAADQALASGSTQVSFTDDPGSPEEKALLAKKDTVAIPLVISADTFATRAEVFDSSANVVPENQIELTANMVAGIMDGNYEQPGQTDSAPCTFNVAGLTGTHSAQCPALLFLNYRSGYNIGTGQTALVRSDAAGVTDQFFNWMCAMKPMSLKLNVNGTQYSAKETYSAEQILKQTFYPHGKVPSSCVATNQFPAIIAPAAGWATVSTPDQQNIKLTNYVQPPGSASTALSGFAPMNMGVASYYGMTMASLQNAAGAFVAPTQSSIYSGIKDGRWIDGIWTPSYSNKKDAKAYAMPVVMYAVVPKSGLSSGQITTLQSMANQILTQTSSKKANLPAGFFALPKSIATMAKSEIASLSPHIAVVTPTVPHTVTTLPAPPVTTPKIVQPPTPSSNPTYGPLTLTATQARLLIPVMIGGGILLALLGFVIVGLALFSKKPAADGELKEHEEFGSEEED